MTKFVYVIQDKQGKHFGSAEFSRQAAREMKNDLERLTAEKLKIVRYTVDKNIR